MPRSARFVGRADVERWHRSLSATRSASVAAIFTQQIFTDRGCYVHDGEGIRSLGTVQPAQVTTVIYRERKTGAWDKHRLSFVDPMDAPYDLSVTDLAWRYY